MNDWASRFLTAVSRQRTSHRKRLFVALLVGALIAFLIQQTQWLGLRRGLLVLLAGQVGVVMALVWRRAQLAGVHASDEGAFVRWFDTEEQFTKRLAVFETACQVAGFLLIGYSLWTSTHALWLALAIGVVYPMTVYFGMTRGRNAAALRNLTALKKI